LFHLFVPQVDKWRLSDKDAIKYSHRIAHYLLPWLKDLHHEQVKEKYVEAAIKGSITVRPVEMPLFEFPA
jgi:lysine-specific demethylase 3